jgi:hypothetical protein
MTQEQELGLTSGLSTEKNEKILSENQDFNYCT